MAGHLFIWPVTLDIRMLLRNYWRYRSSQAFDITHILWMVYEYVYYEKNVFAGAHLCFLQAGADANLSNNVGDTALHKAAFTGRKVRITSITYHNTLRLWIWAIEGYLVIWWTNDGPILEGILKKVAPNVVIQRQSNLFCVCFWIIINTLLDLKENVLLNK